MSACVKQGNTEKVRTRERVVKKLEKAKGTDGRDKKRRKMTSTGGKFQEVLAMDKSEFQTLGAD